MTPDMNNTKTNDDEKWQCQHCLKWFKKSYKYKNHLSRCLVHQDHLNTKYSLMGDMMNDLREELINDFKNELFKMLNDIKNDVKSDIKNNVIHNQLQPKKPIINLF